MTRSMLVRSGALALGAAIALGVPAAISAPATAADAGVLISLDGVAFSASPQGSIFPAGVALIPGSSTTARFWVRNASGVPAQLGISVADASASATAFIDSLTLQAGTPSSPEGTPVPLSGETDCAPLLAGEVLQPGATTEVRLVLALSPEAGNEGQGAAADARLAVTLSDVSAGSATASADCEAGGQLTLGASGSPGGSGAGPSVPGGTAAAPANAAPAAAQAVDGQETVASGALEELDETGLPTFSLQDRPTFAPLVMAGGLILAAGGMVLILLRRRRTRDAAK